jgi:ADP-heptose:LPS heptosyltransferase
MRVLIVRFSAVGDCVLAAWAVTSIRNKYPGAEIIWAIEPRCAPVVDCERLATRLVAFDRQAWKRGRFQPRTWRQQVRTYLSLRALRCDVGIDFQGHSKTALALRLAAPTRRFATHATDWFARAISPPVPLDPATHPHVVDENYATLAAWEHFERVERPMMPDVAAELETVRTRIPHGKPLCTIQTGAGAWDNRYPPELWAEVAEGMIQAGFCVVALGAPGEPHIPHDGVIHRVGATSLREAQAWVRASAVHLCGDTGTGHIAAAVGVPVVSVFGPANPRRTRPFTSRGVVLHRGPNTFDTPPFEVVEAALSLVGASICNS